MVEIRSRSKCLNWGLTVYVALIAYFISSFVQIALAQSSISIDGDTWAVDDNLSYSVDIDGDGVNDQLQHLVRYDAAGKPASMVTVRLATDPPNKPSVHYYIGEQTQIRSIEYEAGDEALILDVLDAATHDVPIIKRIRLRFRAGKLRFVGEEVRSYDGWSALDGTNWIISPTNTDASVNIDVPITMSVDQNKVYGRSGCNDYRGDMVSDEKLGLSIDRISNTRKFCSENNMQVEGWYLGALKQVTEFGFDSGRLVMKYACFKEECKALIFDSMD